MSQLGTFLNWCHKRGHIDKKVEFERPKHDGQRRPHFDTKDWAKLTRFLREWVKQGEHKSGPIVRDRTMLTNYVLILANTGIRIGEARGLRWRDIDTEPTEKPDEFNIILHVRGKTGAREVVARTPEIQTYFQRIWELRTEEIGNKPTKDDYVFCHKDGTQIQTFKKGFAELAEMDGSGFKNSRTLKEALAFDAAVQHKGASFIQRNSKMTNAVEQIQQATKEQGNAAMASVQTLATSVQTIATAHADYAKKAMQDSSEFFTKLTSIKEPAKVMELHSEYMKSAYETFVAEAKKISELYTDFFKQSAKPLEALIAKNKAA